MDGPRYICCQCGKENELQSRDAIRCKACGYKILLKKRQRRLIKLKAR